MSLKLTYYGQNDSVNCTPAVSLSGDPGTDQQTLATAGYFGGIIVALVPSGYSSGLYTYQATNQPAFGVIGNIVPCAGGSQVPFATLLNNGGEFAGAIGPSGSKKAPVVRAMWQGMVDFQAYEAISAVTTPYAVGNYLYCASAAAGAGLYTSDMDSALAVGICTHAPSATEPWLGVASLL